MEKPEAIAEKKTFTRNLFTFSIGTIGRDFLYNFFNGFLLTFVLLTKNLTTAQFGSITFIIVAARIFDALNDPLMGGLVENTRTKFGKYKPWQLIGALLTGAVVVALFNAPVDGWGFIAFLAVCYFLFSITFTMNDISYWGMLPTLTSDANDRNKLTSVAQIFVGIGGGAAGILVPILTTGAVGTAAFGTVSRAFGVIAIVAAVLLVAFQLVTIFGVVEPPMRTPQVKTARLKFKDIFKVIGKNDQLLWAAVCLLLSNVGTNVVTGGLSTMYIYFEFGYDGMLTVLFAALSSVMGILFIFFFPLLMRKFGRAKVLYGSTILVIVGFLALLFVGLFVDKGPEVNIDLLGFHFAFPQKFIYFVVANATTGAGGAYMIMTINMANAVEYNEYRTGSRDESLIVSLRPLTNKMGSALSQGLVSLVYVIAGVLVYTNEISTIENSYAGELTAEQGAEKLERISEVLHAVPDKNKGILLICMCIIPIVFLSVMMVLYKRFFKLDEKKMLEINEVLTQKKGEKMERKYKFFGWETADSKPINDLYPGIKSPWDLYDRLDEKGWTIDTCAPRLRNEWSEENKTAGQCSITAFLAQDIFGGEVYGIPLPGGGVHCYNVVGERTFDLASEQFGDVVLDYSTGIKQYREEHFADEDKRNRYLLLGENVAKACQKE